MCRPRKTGENGRFFCGREALVGARADRFRLRCGEVGWRELLRGDPGAIRGERSSARAYEFLCDRVQIQLSEEARHMIRKAPQPYDVIVSDMTFRQQGPNDMTGQDLLDELRQAKGLPMQTAFIMVTGEARYQHVAEAVEGALDDYLLKPITARQFEERLQVVLERKQAFKQVFQLLPAFIRFSIYCSRCLISLRSRV